MIMGKFIVEDIKWKKGEEGIQKIILFESDGTTLRDLTGKTYEFKFWKRGSGILEGGGSCSINGDPTNGNLDYIVLSTDTDAINNFIGEIIEDPSGAKLRSDTFKVLVEESSDFTQEDRYMEEIEVNKCKKCGARLFASSFCYCETRELTPEELAILEKKN